MLCFSASCGKQNAHPASFVRCGISDIDTGVPSILKANTQCPSCLSHEVLKAIPTCPNDRGLLLLGMYSAYRAKKLEQAVEYYERLAATGNASFEQHADAGYIYDRLGNNVKAVDAFGFAVSGGADAFVQFEYAKALHHAGRGGEAVPILKKIIEEHPKTPPKNGVAVIGEDAVSDEAAALLRQIENDRQRKLRK
jgi:tetratricopeptide (TPR) repeat protein